MKTDGVKLEARSSKLETNLKMQGGGIFKTSVAAMAVRGIGFPAFHRFEFVSDFELRISSFAV